MIDYREAQQLILQQARSFGKEELALEKAIGRVLAESVLADRDYPPFPRATMDGYALRYADLEKKISRYRIVETIFAGDSSDRTLGEGECYRIMTGAAVPVSADILLRREDVQEAPDSIAVKDTGSEVLRRFLNIAGRGEDLAAGDVVIDRNIRCEPAIMGLLATLGKARIKVEQLPKISLLTTGDEVVAVDAPVGPVQIRNSNKWLIEAALKKQGIDLYFHDHVPDDPALLRQRAAQALESDILILCGGVSAGDADHVPAVLEGLGVKKLFHKMAIRPGKPTWCGVLDKTVVFALPGNPFSCLVNMVLLINPYLEACFGLPATQPLGLPMSISRKKRTTLDEFFPVHIAGAPARVEPVSINGSGDIRLGRQANALALHPAGNGDLSEGEEVACYSFV